MEKRTLTAAILTVIIGTGTATFLLLQAAHINGDGDTAAAAKQQQSRAFAAAAAAPRSAPPAAAPARNEAPSTPLSNPIVSATIDDLLAPLIARTAFLQTAERTPEAQQRLAMLTRLQAAFARRHEILAEQRPQPFRRSRPYTPSPALTASARSLGRMWQAQAELDAAINDPSTLTPAAKEQWDLHEAAAWKDAPPSSLPANIESSGLWDYASNENFQQHRDNLTEPLIEEYERLDDRYAETKDHLDATQEKSATPPIEWLNTPDRAIVIAFIEAGTRRANAQNALYSMMRETEKQRCEWTAKSWQGWEESLQAASGTVAQ